MADDKVREIKITIPVPDDLFSLLLPLEALQHARAARKEALLALRPFSTAASRRSKKRNGNRRRRRKKSRLSESGPAGFFPRRFEI